LWIKKPEVVVEVQVMATDILLNIHLAGLREKVQKTQVEMTRALGIRQPGVAGVEKPGRDLKLSILKRYVGGAGGKPRLDVERPDGSHYEFVLLRP
jgi:hypothetical protein